MFKIVEVTESGEIDLLDEDGTLRTFPHGKAAAAQCKVLNATGRKFQPRRLKTADDENWRDREARRLEDGTYTLVPWHHSNWWRSSPLYQIHFTHVSTKVKGMVAFFASEEDGRNNRKTTMRAGKYLTKYFKDVLPADRITSIANDFNAKFGNLELKFAETADEIERVYVNGPDSCMSSLEYRQRQGWGKFRSPFHPTRVYAAGDLKVAYLEEEGRILARALVWPEKKTHSRIYGHIDAMETVLRKAGYKFAPPIGARIKRFAYGDTFVAPYIDRGETTGGGALGIIDEGDYLVIAEDDYEYQCDQLNGLAEKFDEDDDSDEETFICDRCGEEYNSMDDFGEVRIGRTSTRLWCGDCCRNHSFYCEGYNRYYSDVDVDCYTTHDGSVWSQFYYNEYGFTCDRSGDVGHIDCAVSMANGELWLPSVFEEHGFKCQRTGLNYPIEERIEMANGEMWSNEAFDLYGYECKHGEYHPRHEECCCADKAQSACHQEAANETVSAL